MLFMIYFVIFLLVVSNSILVFFLSDRANKRLHDLIPDLLAEKTREENISLKKKCVSLNEAYVRLKKKDRLRKLQEEVKEKRRFKML